MNTDDMAVLYAVGRAPETAWMASAICVETDPEAFFPERGESPNDGKTICRGCLVRSECLAYALENDLTGVWGGTTETERQGMKSSRRLSIAA